MIRSSSSTSRLIPPLGHEGLALRPSYDAHEPLGVARESFGRESFGRESFGREPFGREPSNGEPSKSIGHLDINENPSDNKDSLDINHDSSSSPSPSAILNSNGLDTRRHNHLKNISEFPSITDDEVQASGLGPAPGPSRPGSSRPGSSRPGSSRPGSSKVSPGLLPQRKRNKSSSSDCSQIPPLELKFQAAFQPSFSERMSERMSENGERMSQLREVTEVGSIPGSIPGPPDPIPIPPETAVNYLWSGNRRKNSILKLTPSGVNY
jgi:hypothetical protein